MANDEKVFTRNRSARKTLFTKIKVLKKAIKVTFLFHKKKFTNIIDVAMEIDIRYS